MREFVGGAEGCPFRVVAVLVLFIWVRVGLVFCREWRWFGGKWRETAEARGLLRRSQSAGPGDFAPVAEGEEMVVAACEMRAQNEC